LYASGGGFIFRYVRKGDAVVVLDSLRNDSIAAMYPRVLRDSSGSDFLVTNHSICLLSPSMFAGGGRNPSWWPENLLGDDTSFNLDSDKRITGGVVSGNPESMYLCGGNGGGQVDEQAQVGGALSLGFQALNSGHDYLCDIDNFAHQGVRAVMDTTGSFPNYLQIDSSSLGWNTPIITIPFLPTTVMTAWRHWLAFDSYHQTIATGSSNGLASSVSLPFFYFQPYYPPPVRKDSLVVFAGDSSLVLAKWTPDTFLIQSSIPLGMAVGALAIGDSTLWVGTVAPLGEMPAILSFRFAWTNSPTEVASRSRLVQRLTVTSGPGGTGLLWTGSISAAATIQNLDGRTLDRIQLEPGQTTWWQGGHRGVYLASTPAGVAKFLVR
jgi:hypothetical protein